MTSQLNQRLQKLTEHARAEFAQIVARDPWDDFAPAQALLGKIALELSLCLTEASSPAREALAEAIEDAEALSEWEAAAPEDEDDRAFDVQEHIASFWNEVDAFIEALPDLTQT